MQNKTKMRKIKTKQNIDSPIFDINGKDMRKYAVVFCHPAWETDEGKSIAMEKVRELCEKVKAKRVLSISDKLTHRFGGKKNKNTGSLCITLQMPKNLEVVFQPYTIDIEGNISFGEEIWSTKTDKYPSRKTCERFVQ